MRTSHTTRLRCNRRAVVSERLNSSNLCLSTAEVLVRIRLSLAIQGAQKGAEIGVTIHAGSFSALTTGGAYWHPNRDSVVLELERV
jgi:hypothetical protein